MWWKILLGVIALIALLIVAILRLRVYIIIKSDDEGELMLRYKILWKTFGEHPDPNNPILKAVKKATGIERIESRLGSKAKSGDSAGNGGSAVELEPSAVELVDIIGDLLKELVAVLKYCTATKFQIEAMRASDDAADAAIAYGEYCAIVYPLIGAFANALKRIRKRGKRIDIKCGFNGEEDYIRYNFTVFIRLHRVIAALLRISIAEGKRQAERDEQLARARRMQQKNQQDSAGKR